MAANKHVQTVLEGINFFLTEVLPNENLTGKAESTRLGLVLQLRSLFDKLSTGNENTERKISDSSLSYQPQFNEVKTNTTAVLSSSKSYDDDLEPIYEEANEKFSTFNSSPSTFFHDKKQSVPSPNNKFFLPPKDSKVNSPPPVPPPPRKQIASSQPDTPLPLPPRNSPNSSSSPRSSPTPSAVSSLQGLKQNLKSKKGVPTNIKNKPLPPKPPIKPEFLKFSNLQDGKTKSSVPKASKPSIDDEDISSLYLVPDPDSPKESSISLHSEKKFNLSRDKSPSQSREVRAPAFHATRQNGTLPYKSGVGSNVLNDLKSSFLFSKHEANQDNNKGNKQNENEMLIRKSPEPTWKIGHLSSQKEKNHHSAIEDAIKKHSFLHATNNLVTATKVHSSNDNWQPQEVSPDNSSHLYEQDIFSSDEEDLYSEINEADIEQELNHEFFNTRNQLEQSTYPIVQRTPSPLKNPLLSSNQKNFRPPNSSPGSTKKNESESDKEIYVARYDFAPNITQGLALKKGDEMIVTFKHPTSGWWKARIGAQEGLVPKDYLMKK